MEEAELRQAAVLMCEHFGVRKPGMASLIVGQAKEYANARVGQLEAERDASKERAERAELLLELAKAQNAIHGLSVTAALKSRDEQASAVGELLKVVVGGKRAMSGLRQCPCSSGGAGGQTVEACLDRLRFHQVPLSIFDAMLQAEAELGPVAEAALVAAVKEVSGG